MQASSQHDISKKAELDSEYLCFDEFPELRFGLAAKLQTEKLAGDLQDAEYLFVKNFVFCNKNAIFSWTTKISLIHF
jgi:hypothetical protein